MFKKIFGIALSLSLSLSLSLVLSTACMGEDATSFDPRPIQVSAKSSGGVPVGTVIAWPVATNPEDTDKWLECNGQSTAGYDELAAIVGANVPDYRGLFLRGHGSQNFNSGGYGNISHSSGNLKAIQGDSIRNITGSVASLWHSFGSGAIQFSYFYSPHDGYSGAWGGGNPAVFSLDASRVTPTANEIRPVNTAVRYLIRSLK